MSRNNVRLGDRLPLSTLFQTLIKDPYYGYLGDKRVDELITTAGGKYLLIGLPATPKIVLLLMAWARMEPGGLPVFKPRQKKEVTKKRLLGFYSESDSFQQLETTSELLRNFLTQHGLPVPHKLFPKDQDNTKDEAEFELGWKEATEISDLNIELKKTRTHLDSLQPSDPEYIRRKRDGEAEVGKLISKIADKQTSFNEQIKTLRDQQAQGETIQERNKRLQLRVNQLYPTHDNLNQTIDQIYEEEQRPGGSGISRETLRRIVRTPK